MKEFWDQRYSEEGFAYGEQPNAFLHSQRQRLRAGQRALVLGDGEGRNGVWLAEQGLRVTTVDYSAAGVEKSRQLARRRGVEIEALCEDVFQWQWPREAFDVAVLIYLHFPSASRPEVHRRVLEALRPAGLVLVEAFNKDQLDYPSGGPPERDMLFSAAELADDFAAAEIELLEERVVELSEGKYHVGPGAVVRLVAHKSARASDTDKKGG